MRINVSEYREQVERDTFLYEGVDYRLCVISDLSPYNRRRVNTLLVGLTDPAITDTDADSAEERMVKGYQSIFEILFYDEIPEDMAWHLDALEAQAILEHFGRGRRKGAATAA